MKGAASLLWNGLLASAAIVLLLLWGRSYWRYDWVTYSAVGKGPPWYVTYNVQSSSGVLWFDRVYFQGLRPHDAQYRGRIRDELLAGEGSFVVRPSQPVTSESRRALFSRAPGRGWGLLGFWKQRWVHQPPLPPELATRTITDNITFPYWLPTLLLGIWPALKFRRWIRQRRASFAGLCRICGYDLRASGERCPECGTPIAPPARRAVSAPGPS